MAGVKGSRDRVSTSPAYANAVRARIQAGGLVVYLQNHVIGKREMSPSQVAAALGLLKKVVPDKTENKNDTTLRYGPLLNYEQAVTMAEAVIESGRRSAVSPSEPNSVHSSEPA